jgi:AraC-like DNA-binding protein
MQTHSDELLPVSRDDLGRQISDAFFAEVLFDTLPGVIFFVTDRQGRFVVVNETLAARYGVADKQLLSGRKGAEFFATSLVADYDVQDQFVLCGEGELRDQLELHHYPEHGPVWVLTHKIAVLDRNKNIIGIASTSRDLAMPDQRHPVYHQITAAVRHLHTNYSGIIHMADLTSITSLPAELVERYFHKIFSLTPRQMMIKIRLTAASALLVNSTTSISEIAAACGYQDYAVFSSVFKVTVGLTPEEYRISGVKKEA